MYKVKTLNNISPSVLEVLRSSEYELGDNVEHPDALVVRASDMHEYDFDENTMCL